MNSDADDDPLACSFSLVPGPSNDSKQELAAFLEARLEAWNKNKILVWKRKKYRDSLHKKNKKFLMVFF